MDWPEIKLPASEVLTTSILGKIIGNIKGWDDDMPCATNIWFGDGLDPVSVELSSDKKANYTYVEMPVTTQFLC